MSISLKDAAFSVPKNHSKYTIAHSFQQQNLMKMNNLKNESNLYFQVKLQSSLIVSYETLQRKRSLYNVLKLTINSLHIHKKH